MLAHTPASVLSGSLSGITMYSQTVAQCNNYAGHRELAHYTSPKTFAIVFNAVERYRSLPCVMTLTQLQKLKYYCKARLVSEGMEKNLAEYFRYDDALK